MNRCPSSGGVENVGVGDRDPGGGRPEHVFLVVEAVSPGSEITDRIVRVDQ